MGPGTYTVIYDCKDAAGNKATPLMRTVKIQDTTCPVVKITGASVLSIEAGFPYLDSVDTSKAFYAKRSCAEIRSADKLAKSGTYFITASNFKRVKVFCDMKASQTWYKCKNCKKTRPNRGGHGSCSSRGLVIARSVPAAAKAQFGAAYATVNENTNTYLCTMKNPKYDHLPQKVKHSDIAHAETGKYIVTYRVKDKAGNKQCKVAKRTVIVSDTLPPVIALKLNGKLIHTSGTKNAANPAFNKKINPFLATGLMEEETTSVNGWVIGAIGAAVAGVALLGISQKPTVVSVPV